jgi:Flp pilus assembly protein CpaB
MLPPGAVIGGPAEDLDGDSFPDVYDYVVGKQLRTSTVLFEPILDNMLNEKGRIHLSGEGSDVALAAPRDRVVIAYPLPSIEDDPTAAVAYALRPGDHVDMIVSLALVDLDEDFHTILPNTTQLLDFAEGGDGGEGETLRLVEFPTGRIEQGPLGLTFNIIPSEDEQRSRVVTQLTVQDVIVMRVGRYPTLEEEILGIDMQVRPEPTATPAVVATPEATPVPQPQQQGQQQQAEEAPTPTPEPPMPEVIVLAVSPQEALVINFAWQINAKVSFALRAVGDEGVFFTTNSVTLQYLMEQYNIAVPPKMQYGIQPPVGTVQEFVAGGGE